MKERGLRVCEVSQGGQVDYMLDLHNGSPGSTSAKANSFQIIITIPECALYETDSQDIL